MSNDSDEFFSKVGTMKYRWICGIPDDEDFVEDTCAAVLTNDTSLHSERQCHQCKRFFIRCSCEKSKAPNLPANFLLICVHSPQNPCPQFLAEQCAASSPSEPP